MFATIDFPGNPMAVGLGMGKHWVMPTLSHVKLLSQKPFRYCHTLNGSSKNKQMENFSV